MFFDKWKKKMIYTMTSVFLVVVLCSNVVKAAETAEPIDTRSPVESAISTEAAYAMTVDSNGWDQWPKGPQTYGEANIVMDADTGTILYAKNIDGKAYPASITKILTMLVALENGKLEDTVTFSSESVYSVPYGYAHIAMKENEEIKLEDALYGMMLASANEVAYSIGESIGQNLGKDYNWFIEKMNERCKELGGVNSNFVNTNGLEDENHYTTARDMALITQELLINHPEFEEVCQTLQYTIPETNLTNETRTFQQNHKMFYKSNEHYDERVIAGKTGYTEKAFNTLVTCADDGNMRLICVNLKTHGPNVYLDTENLLNYGFDNFEQIDVSASTLEKSKAISSYIGNTSITVPKGVTFDDLKVKVVDNADHKTAKVIYSYNDTIVGELKVELSQSYIDETYPKNEESNPSNEKSQIPLKKFIIYGLVGIVTVIAVLGIILIVLIIRKKRKIRERKRRKQAAMRKRRMQEERRRMQQEIEEQRRRF